jgi:hypothetical protein
MTTKPETPGAFAQTLTIKFGLPVARIDELFDLITARDEFIRAEGRERIAELEAALEKAQWTAEYLAGYQADLAAIDRALDAVNAPHDPEDGASLSPKRIRLMGERIASLEAKLATREGAAKEALREAALVCERRANSAHSWTAREVLRLASDEIAKLQVSALLTSPSPRGCSCDSPAVGLHDVACPLNEAPPRVDGWVPVSERLPPNGRTVLAFGYVTPYCRMLENSRPERAVAFKFEGEKHFRVGLDSMRALYWAPILAEPELPAPPSRPDAETEETP